MVEVQIYLILFCVFLPLVSSPLVQGLLKKHASDDPKLSYTGEPIVKWPERVSREQMFTHFRIAGNTQQHTSV